MKKIYTLLMATIIILSGCKKDDTSTGPEDVTKTIPVLTTIEVSNITSTSAKSGGKLTSDGGATVTSRGVCWGMKQTPTILNSKTTDGEGIGTFTSTITGLVVGTKYYVRAYATNSVGTSYGTTLPFTSSSIAPTLETVAISNITSNMASSGGNISSDGGSSVITRGVCWSTNENPVVSENKTTDGEGTGTFTSTITGLAVGTKYYVRAYATNSVGTSYGNLISFTTTTPEIIYGTLSFNGFIYTTVTIGTQEWTVENLRTTTYNDQTAISTVRDATEWSNLETGAYTSYNNEENNIIVYGHLYNWYAVGTGKLAPTSGGWRVPTDADWVKLENFLGSNEGEKLKAKSGWDKNGNGTDEYGFNALPGGVISAVGHFGGIGYLGGWWSSSSGIAKEGVYYYMFYDYKFMVKVSDDKNKGFSIRLVRDK